MHFKSLLLMTCFMSLSACGEKVKKKELPDNNTQSNVELTASGNAVTGNLSFDAEETQVIVASDESNLAEHYVEFPAGSVSENLQVTVAPGQIQTSLSLMQTLENFPSDLNMPENIKIVDGSNPIYVNDNLGTDLLKAMTINIPLPVDEIANADTALQGTKSKLAILYAVRINGVNHIGLAPLTVANLKGTIVTYESLYFGWFRLVGLTESSEAVGPVVSTQIQILAAE